MWSGPPRVGDNLLDGAKLEGYSQQIEKPKNTC